MKFTRSAAVVAGIALLGSLLVNAAPATAQTLALTNPLVTPITTDPDIESLDIAYGDTSLTVTAHLQNVAVAATTIGFVAMVAPSANSLYSSPGTMYFGGQFSRSTVTTEAMVIQANGTEASLEVPVTLSRDAAARTITVTVPTSALPNPLYAGGYVDYASSRLEAGASKTVHDINGFGPIIKGTPPTTTALALSWPSQGYNSTPAYAKATVTPADAAGTVQFFDGPVLLGSTPVTAGFAYFAIPTETRTGIHSITAAFVPAVAGGYQASRSAPTELEVVSTAEALKTTITLSKSTQKYRKKASKLTVRVEFEAEGSVIIKDGKKTLASVDLTRGKATYTFSKKLKKGTHSITATFVPDDHEEYRRSTSTAKKLKVVA